MAMIVRTLSFSFFFFGCHKCRAVSNDAYVIHVGTRQRRRAPGPPGGNAGLRTVGVPDGRTLKHPKARRFIRFTQTSHDFATVGLASFVGSGRAAFRKTRARVHVITIARTSPEREDNEGGE